MVITYKISIQYRLHCVRINALRAFGIHGIERIPELRYSMRSSAHHLEFRITVTVGSNINRRDDSTITSGRALYFRDRCTFHYEMAFPLY